MKGQGHHIRGGGASRPKHMTREEWAEYKRTEEYKQEASGFDYNQFEPAD